ncbi:DNA adenine methylase [Flavobacterium johnsoniae]|nr:DNA adenine methylase [Flavobacterium johnsoniae]
MKSKILKEHKKDVPHIIKYMGSKRKILDFVMESISDVYSGGTVCDLFAGTSIISGALGAIVPVHSNDIQNYSSIFAKTYLSNFDKSKNPNLLVDQILTEAEENVRFFKSKYPIFNFEYTQEIQFCDFIKIEKQEKELINYDFDVDFHLFTKYYSGTYWSYEQCLWIDSLVKVSRNFNGTGTYQIILASIMHAMSYTSQSTGHFAQFRTTKDEDSMRDILSYRLKSFTHLFKNKFLQLYNFIDSNDFTHKITNLDFSECLDVIEEGSVVYADPPYASVHYSRFYHALETLVKYDYPEVKHKGRYRVDRHQSPFSRKSEAKKAFAIMFEKISQKRSQLVLSYSNAGVITLDEILDVAHLKFKNYTITTKYVDYKHSTMGRKFDKNVDVTEILVIAKLNS